MLNDPITSANRKVSRRMTQTANRCSSLLMPQPIQPQISRPQGGEDFSQTRETNLTPESQSRQNSGVGVSKSGDNVQVNPQPRKRHWLFR
jgi:hypothetical protein